MKKYIWKITEAGNAILNGDEFYVSYLNPETQSEFAKEMDAVAGGLIQVVMGNRPERTKETALCRDGSYLILKGDWRKDYEKIIDKGYGACKKFYDKKKDKYDSDWSS